MTSLRFFTFTFCNYYILKLLHCETITFSDATLSNINVVLRYVLSQYQANGRKDSIGLLAMDHGPMVGGGGREVSKDNFCNHRHR